MERSATPEKVWWRVSDRVRERIAFRRFNLVEFPYPLKGNIDIIFCRNVMIYFEHAEREGLVLEIERLLRPGGMLFVGHAETLNGIPHALQRVAPSTFEKPAGTSNAEQQR